MDFARVLREITGFFEREGFSHAVIGAIGLHAYGLSRATSDLDFVTESQAQARLITFLESLGYETLHVSAGYSNHLHTDSAMGRLDFVYVEGNTSRQLFGAVQKMTVLGGISMPVPRAEHLAAMKIQAMKNDPERTFQEMADIQFLMGLPGVDRDQIRGYFEKSGQLERFHELERSL